MLLFLLHAFANRDTSRWGWRLFAGIVDLIPGIILMANISVMLTLMPLITVGNKKGMKPALVSSLHCIMSLIPDIISQLEMRACLSAQSSQREADIK